MVSDSISIKIIVLISPTKYISSKHKNKRSTTPISTYSFENKNTVLDKCES